MGGRRRCAAAPGWVQSLHFVCHFAEINPHRDVWANTVVSNRALQAIRLFFPLFVFSALACGVLDVGIERTPVPDYAATQTLTALVAQNSALTARISALATPTLRELGKIAYVSNGNIWIKNLPADTAWPLTSPGQNREPNWAASR